MFLKKRKIQRHTLLIIQILSGHRLSRLHERKRETLSRELTDGQREGRRYQERCLNVTLSARHGRAETITAELTGDDRSAIHGSARLACLTSHGRSPIAVHRF